MSEIKSASGKEILFTEGMSHCYAFVLLTGFDKREGVYKKRHMMHVAGSNLDMSISTEDGQGITGHGVIMDFMNRLEGTEHKVIIAHGHANHSELSREITRGQEYNGRQLIKELMNDSNVTVVQHNECSSIKVNATGDVLDV